MAKPIAFSHIPKDLHHEKPPAKSSHDIDFLNADTSRKLQQDSHDVVIRPSERDIPWPSSFPAARQCKYWEEAQASCEELMQEIRRLRAQLHKAAPKGYSDSANGHPLTPKESIIATCAVDAATYMVPNASCERAKVIAKLWMLLWTQDDVMEYDQEQGGSTVVDEITNSLIRLSQGLEEPAENKACTSLQLTPELLDIPGGLMRTELKTFAEYILFTRKPQRTEFKGLRDFLDYRTVDIAMDHILASVRLGNDLDLSQEQIYPLRPLLQLASDHCILINDLYSFDKEKRAAATQDALILNTVNYLEQTLSVSSPFAKNLTLRLEHDVELKMQDELCQLAGLGTLGEDQMRYAHAAVECASGNLIFCVTSLRYGKEGYA